jgi:flavorubredoxin
MNIVIIYDSKSGNTQKMAEAIAKGALKEADSVVVKKIGESFPLTILAESDGVIFGSPVYYADVTRDMKDFIDHVENYIEAGRREINNIPAAVFGSYGYDGAWIMEEKLKERIQLLGFDIFDEVCVLIDNDIKYNEQVLKECEEFGEKFAKSL